MNGLYVRSELPWMAVVVATVLVLPGSTAHAAEQWVGSRVMLKRGVVLKVGNQLVHDKEQELEPVLLGSAENWTRNAYRPYLVEQVNGPWLWVVPEFPKFGGASGWVKTGDVLRPEQVDDYFTAQIRIKPTPEDYLDRGFFREKDDVGLAIADYGEAIRLDPKFAKAYYYRGVGWRIKKEYDKAIADYTEVIRLKPEFFMAYYSRGLAWGLQEQYDKAIADYTEAIRLFPECISALINRGIDRAKKNEYDQAIADFNEALRLNPKSQKAYIARAAAWSFKEEYDRAIADYSEAIRLDPNNALQVYYNRASAFYAKEDYGKSIADLNQVIALDPTFAPAHNKRAWLLASCPDAKVRNGADAIDAAVQYCELTHWKNGDSLSALAAAYAENGDFETAVEWQKIANSSSPKASPAAVSTGNQLLNLYKSKKPFRMPRGVKVKTAFHEGSRENLVAAHGEWLALR